MHNAFNRIKCFGSTTVGPRGQVVIPASARRELGIEAGVTLLVFRGLGDRGLLLVKATAIEEILSAISERMSDFEKLASALKPRKPKGGKGVAE